MTGINRKLAKCLLVTNIKKSPSIFFFKLSELFKKSHNFYPRSDLLSRGYGDRLRPSICFILYSCGGRRQFDKKINFREPATGSFYPQAPCPTCLRISRIMVKEDLELFSLPGRGRAEVIRLMLTFCGKPFTDTRMTIAQWKIKRKQGKFHL